MPEFEVSRADLPVDDAGDQEAADNEEHVDAGISTCETEDTEMEQDDR